MKVGERGQVTIPKPLRERFAIGPSTEVEFIEQAGELVLRKRLSQATAARQRRDRISSCIGVLNGQPEDVDEFIENIRGR
jgi:AbrB family looped-hinge helix DNA binding protein